MGHLLVSQVVVLKTISINRNNLKTILSHSCQTGKSHKSMLFISGKRR